MIAQLDETHPTTQFAINVPEAVLEIFKWPAQLNTSHCASLFQCKCDYALIKFH